MHEDARRVHAIRIERAGLDLTFLGAGNAFGDSSVATLASWMTIVSVGSLAIRNAVTSAPIVSAAANTHGNGLSARGCAISAVAPTVRPNAPNMGR